MLGLRQRQQGRRQSAEREVLLSAPDWVWKGGKREALRVVLLWAAGWMVVPFNKVQVGRRSRFGGGKENGDSPVCWVWDTGTFMWGCPVGRGCVGLLQGEETLEVDALPREHVLHGKTASGTLKKINI